MTATLQNYTGRLYVMTCAACGVPFALTTDFEEARRADSRRFYCPNGHTLSWHESDADRAKKRADAAERTAASLRAALDQANAAVDHQRNRVNGYKGALAKTKKRAAAGVCPAPGCQRHFSNVAAHVRRMHPAYLEETRTDAS
jgi:uncharacterized protein YbaA (DUF1428 family)